MKLFILIITFSISSHYGISQCDTSTVLRTMIDRSPFMEGLFAHQRGEIRFNSFDIIATDTIYCISDSSVFNGDILYIDAQPNNQSTAIHRWTIKNGINVSNERRQYLAFRDPVTGRRTYPDSMWLHSVSHNDLNHTSYFQNGTIASKNRHVDFIDSLDSRVKIDSTLKYHENGAMKYSRIISNTQGESNIYSTEITSFDTNEVITNYEFDFNLRKDNIVFHTRFETNGSSDTLLLETYLNDKRQSKFIRAFRIRLNTNEDSLVTITSQWKNDNLIEIEDHGIIFLDKKHRVISKAEFIKQSDTPFVPKNRFNGLFTYRRPFLARWNFYENWMYPIPLDQRSESDETLIIATQNWKLNKLNYKRVFRQHKRLKAKSLS